MATLSASFDSATASVTLVIDGTSWSTVPDTVTAVRSVPGGSDDVVRGVIDKEVVDGYLVATDHEMDINSSVTYTVTGYVSGSAVETASATVSTTCTEPGVWVKAPGRPDMSLLCQPATVGEISSPTVGGTYQVLGGEAVAIAQFSGVAPESFQITLRTDAGEQTDALRALLADFRVILLQPVGVDDIDPGWYFIGQANRSNPGGFNAFGFRYTSLTPVSSRAPAGQAGGATWTYAALAEVYATYADRDAAYSSYFEMSQGPA